MIKTKIPNSVDTDIRFAGTRDMLQVYDPYKKQWLDWKRTGKVILPSVITVTTSTLDGEPVTCRINNESYTTTFISGVAVFKVYSLGTATITCGTYSTTVSVDTDSGEYSAELERFLWIVKDGELLLSFKNRSNDDGVSIGKYQTFDSVTCISLSASSNYPWICVSVDGTNPYGDYRQYTGYHIEWGNNDTTTMYIGTWDSSSKKTEKAKTLGGIGKLYTFDSEEFAEQFASDEKIYFYLRCRYGFFVRNFYMY